MRIGLGGWLTVQARDGKVGKDAPVELWQGSLKLETESAQTRLGKPIHKGAPNYNCALCCFLAGNLDQGYGFISAAATEDLRSFGAKPERLLTGAHPLSRQLLQVPLKEKLLPGWANDYSFITGQPLQEPELISLLTWIFLREADGMQAMLALHSWLSIDLLPDDKSAQLLRNRVVRELHLVLESVLRAQGIGSGQLQKRMQAALNVNPIAVAAFTLLHTWFLANVPAVDKETAAGLNLVLAEAQSRFGAASSRGERAGIAGYANVRVRNSVQHVIDEKTALFTQPSIADRMSAWALSSLRNVMHSAHGTL